MAATEMRTSFDERQKNRQAVTSRDFGVYAGVRKNVNNINTEGIFMKPLKNDSLVFGHLPKAHEVDEMRSTAQVQFNSSPGKPPRTANKVAGVAYRMNLSGMHDSMLHTVNELRDNRPTRYEQRVPVNPTTYDTKSAWE